MIGEPDSFWGKLSPRGGPVEAWHPLADHCADVAAVTSVLLEQPVIQARLNTLAGDELEAPQRSRLVALAALHDLGKYNLGFQNKALEKPPFVAGHIAPLVELLADDYDAKRRLIEALDLPALLAFTGGDDVLLLDYLEASWSHHGKPAHPRGSPNLRCWEPARGLDPFQGIAELMAQVRTWVPAAFSDDARALPDVPALPHAFAGLVSLADWIGSDRHAFPFSDGDGDRFTSSGDRARVVLREIGLDAQPARDSLGPEPPPFGRLATFDANAVQRHLLDLPTDARPSVAVIEAATGSGKTEAALARYLRLFHAGQVDGLYFALPTRTAATEIHGRLRDAVARAFPDPSRRPPVILAVPGYLRFDAHQGRPLPGFEVLWDDDPGAQLHFRGWAAEHPKRFLAGSVVVGTIDQALLSTLQVNHAHLRASALLRHLLVVDEVHASDAYMTRLTQAVLDRHLAAGGHAVLMSATLGATARHALLHAAGPPPSLETARETPYPLVSQRLDDQAPVEVPVKAGEQSKALRFGCQAWMETPEAIAERALAAARAGARVLVVRNTVKGAVAVQRALEAVAGAETDRLFRCGGVPTLHHSRFAREDRARLDRAIETAFGKGTETAGLVCVATQTVQQSLDLDADLLLTDLCPMDVLLQRVGRLHRHTRARPEGFGVATCEVLVPEDPDLGRFIRRDGSASGPHGLGTVYGDLRILAATWKLLARTSDAEIPRDNRRLVEDALHPEVLDRVATAGGERWQAHGRTVEGLRLAHVGRARVNLVDWHTRFDEVRFPSGDVDEIIKTRLGEGDRDVSLPEAVPGPFGAPLQRLTLPAYLAAGAADTDVSTDVQATDGTVRFRFGPHRYVYDRLGLRRDTAATGEEPRAP